MIAAEHIAERFIWGFLLLVLSLMTLRVLVSLAFVAGLICGLRKHARLRVRRSRIIFSLLSAALFCWLFNVALVKNGRIDLDKAGILKFSISLGPPWVWIIPILTGILTCLVFIGHFIDCRQVPTCTSGAERQILVRLPLFSTYPVFIKRRNLKEWIQSELVSLAPVVVPALLEQASRELKQELAESAVVWKDLVGLVAVEAVDAAADAVDDEFAEETEDAEAISELSKEPGHRDVDTPIDSTTTPRRSFPRRMLLGAFIVCSLLAGSALLLDWAPWTQAHPAAGPTTQRGPRPSTHPATGPSGRPEAVLTEPGGSSVSAMVFSPDGRTLATEDASNSNTYLWNVASRALIATFSDPGGNDNGVDDVAFSPDGRTLATVDVNGNTCLWNVATRTLAAILPNPGPGYAMADVAFNPDGRTFATVDQGGGTYLWNVATRTLAATLTSPAPVSSSGSGPSVDVAAFSPDGRTIATADDYGNVSLWNLSTRTRSATMYDPGGNAVEDVAFSRNSHILATTDVNGNTYLWNVATRKLTATFASTGSSSYAGSAFSQVDAIAFSPDSRTLATGDQSGSILYLWNLATGKHAAAFQDPNNNRVIYYPDGSVFTPSVLAVAFSPDGRTLAVSDLFGHIDLWDMSWLDS